MGRIEIEGLSRAYGNVQALHNLDLEIEDGEFVTLLGPSGCGKTTILNLLAGFLEPNTGTIRVDDQVMSQPNRVVPPERRGMGMVFQSYALWPHKTVFKNVAYGLQRQGKKKKEIAERVSAALELVGLSGFESRYPSQLSGGQQQRVALARSIVTEPSILLLDEPLSNLDAKLRDSMRFEVQEIQRRLATTFVYVTHDQVEAMAISDRIAVLNDGHLHQFATPREVYNNPADSFVADFMGLINFIPGRVKDLRGSTVTVQVVMNGDSEVVVASAENAPRSPGEETIIAIRPECFTILTGYQELGPNRLGSGEIVNITPLGNINHLYVEIDGEVIRVQSDGLVEHQIGDKVTLEVAPGRGRAFGMSEALPFLTRQRERNVHSK